MSEAIKVVGNVLKRAHIRDDQTTSTATVQGSAEEHLYGLLLGPDCNVTTTWPEYDAISVVERDGEREIVVLELKRYDVALMYQAARETMWSRCHAWSPVAKNINWQIFLAPHHGSESPTSASAFGEQIAHMAVAGLGESATAKVVPDVTELLQYLMVFSGFAYAKALASRVLELDQDLLDEGEGERLSASSLFSLIQFLHAKGGLARPSLAVGRGGYLIARWKRSGHGEVNIHFRTDGSMTFYAFVPSEEHVESGDFLSVSTKAESLLKRLTQLQLLSLLR